MPFRRGGVCKAIPLRDLVGPDRPDIPRGWYLRDEPRHTRSQPSRLQLGNAGTPRRAVTPKNRSGDAMSPLSARPQLLRIVS
jgi:hypothetical protein